MALPPPSIPTPPAPSPLLRVLSDAALLRHVASFQRGMPLALFAFWCASDATIAAAAREDGNLIHARHGELLAKILAHDGDDLVRLLDMFESIRYIDYDHKGFHWAAPRLDRVVREAVVLLRADLLDWAIAHDTIADAADASRLWGSALDGFAAADDDANDSDVGVALLTRLLEAVPLDQSVVTALYRKFPRVRLLRWLGQVFPNATLPPTMTALAVQRDDLATVQWLCEHRASDGCSPDAFTNALRRDNLAILEYLLAHRIDALDWQNACILLEESSGESRVLVHRFSSAFPPVPAGFVQYAIETQDFGILAALADTGLLADVSLDEQAEIGDLEMIEWLHETGLATATHDAVDRAAASGHWHVALFLLEHRTEGCSVDTLVAAVETGVLELVEFVYQRLPQTASLNVTSVADRTEPMDRAAAAGHLAIVRFLHDHGFGCTTNAVDQAVAGGHVQVATFLLTHRTEGCTVVAVRSALRSGCVELVRIIYQRQPQLFDAESLAELMRHEVKDGSAAVEPPDESLDSSPNHYSEAAAASQLEGQDVLRLLKEHSVSDECAAWVDAEL